MAGYDWYYGFMKRHRNLSLRTPEQTSLNRVKSFCAENVIPFFNQLNELLTEKNYRPGAIWNMDETGFSTVPSKAGKVLSLKGVKRVGSMTSGERGTLTTMALSVNAAGGFIPPFFVFSCKRMQNVYLEHATPEARGVANGSGWMQQPDFVQYMQHFIEHSNSLPERPTLLLLDNHASHLSIEALDLAAENGVTMLSFPPHCTYRMQPLDVAVFGPVKTYYATQHNAWMRNNAGKALEVRHIPDLVKFVLNSALVPRNIVSGFEATGICQFNPDVFTDADFLAAALNGENTAATQHERQIDAGEQRRIISTGLPAPAAFEEVTTSNEPTTSAASMSRSTSLSSVLTDIGPLQKGEPKKKSNRGRKPMKSSVLTTPENIASL